MGCIFSVQKYFDEIRGVTPKADVKSSDAKDMRVAYDFDGNPQMGTISVRRNELVVILDNSDEVWAFVKKYNDAKGYVPFSYLVENSFVALEDEWFFEDVNRRETIHILNQLATPGGFLVRKAQTKNGYSLSVYSNEGVVRHYIIEYEYGRYSLRGSATFDSVQDLIKAYQMCNFGICCKLTVYPPRVAPSVNSLAKDVWEVPRESISLHQQIGQGQFGEVWLGTYNKSVNVAVKTLKPGSMSPSDFLHEANIMKKMKHPNLLQLMAVCTEGEPIYIITEFLENGSLLVYLKKMKSNLHLQTLVEFASQVSEGMAYLEKRNFIHRDLAARNVLVGGRNECKVADFGLARVIIDNEYCASKDSKFPVKWTAPEAALHSSFTIKSDVWSFGILLHEIMSLGEVPYKGMNNTEAIHKVINGYRMPKTYICPDNLYEIMLNCWSSSPQDRPTFEHISEQLSCFNDCDDRYK